MKQTLLALVLILPLAGCNPFGEDASLAEMVAQVQEKADQICGVVPTAATVAAIVSGYHEVAVTAGSVANGICAAVASYEPPVGLMANEDKCKGWYELPDGKKVCIEVEPEKG